MGRSGVDDGTAYPAAWEADVVLRDGTTTHVRPIRGSDADALQAFHLAQSPESTYLRFFAHLGQLPAADLARFTQVDHHDRVALVAVATDDRIIGVGRFERVGPVEAEVAFNVADSHQGKGVASVLLEHLAAAARERDVRRFTAQLLPENERMIAVFREAGFAVSQELVDGVVSVAFDVDPTERSRAVMAQREHHAEARSVRRLLAARSVVVVASPRARPGTVEDLLARQVLTDLTETSSGIQVHVVGLPATGSAQHWPDLAAVPGPVDLGVLSVPAEEAVAAVRALADLDVRGVVVASGGFAEAGPDGLQRQRSLLRTAHAAGMRVIGPQSYGLIVTTGRLLNASLAAQAPLPGRIGVFCQSASAAVPLLAAVARRAAGISQFVSAGNRADVSGNDLLQFWRTDPATDVACLYLESIGNPRKFSRVARALTVTRPVVVVTAGRFGQVVPPGHVVRPTLAPPRTLDQVMRQAGVIRVDNIHQMLDVAQLLTLQPLPTGRRAAVVTSSAATAALVVEEAAAAGLTLAGPPTILPQDVGDAEVAAAVTAVYADPAVDVVVVAHVPTVGTDPTRVSRAAARAAAGSGRATVAWVLGLHGATPTLTFPGPTGRAWTVPAYATVEDAVLALGHAARYASWRTADHGTLVHPSGLDLRRARRLVDRWLAGDEEVVDLDAAQTAMLLSCAGVDVAESVPVHTVTEALAAARHVGWPVAVTCTAPALWHRADLGGLRLDVADEAELRAVVAQLLAVAAPYEPAPGRAPLEVQRMVPRGTACVVRTAEDPLFGPVVSFGIDGDATDLLGDVSYGVPPLTDVDVARMVRTPRAAALLFGYRGRPALDVPALEDVLARVSVLADEVPELRGLELRPAVVGRQGTVVLSARARLGAADRADRLRRALPV